MLNLLIYAHGSLVSTLGDQARTRCLGLLHRPIVEQFHKKLEFVEYLFRCSYNSTIFSRIECVELKPFD
jgi:hypothetical protein